ncbi:MAG: hypothetical protein K6G04_04320 [Lachnospiraceae bacterium]|nr:hypothetical protein [Lachnospiraceae bacterium]
MKIIGIIAKILGFGVLGILGLVLLLLLYVLLTPIRYELVGAWHTKGRLDVKVYDALHLVCYHILYDDGTTTSDLRLLWKHSKDKEEEPEEETEEEEAVAAEPEEEPPEEAGCEVDSPPVTETKAAASTCDDATTESAEFKHRHKQREEKKHKPSKEPRQSEETKQRLQRIRALLQDEDAMEGLHKIIREVVGFLRRLSPKKAIYDITFSTGEPDTTGKLVALLASIPWLYRNQRHRILPDFASEEGYLQGDATIGGYLQLYHVLALAIRIFFDRNVRKLYAHIKGL